MITTDAGNHASRGQTGRTTGMYSPKRMDQAEANGATDDEILGLVGSDHENVGSSSENADAGTRLKDAAAEDAGENRADAGEDAAAEKSRAAAETAELREALEANPELRRAWDEAHAYREAFGTPEEARRATELIRDLNRMDALFFSSRPEDHVELARSIAQLDPNSFASLLQAMNQEAGKRSHVQSGATLATRPVGENETSNRPAPQQESGSAIAGFSPAQRDFLQATNAAAVQSVVEAIETQVDRLLPEGAPKNTRSRVVGEIYRELDAALRENRQLTEQVREAFRSGALDASHQRAIVSLISGRARQALPGVTRKVMSEWTSTVLAASHDRRARQRAAEKRVDIAGTGGAANDGRRARTPQDIDYARMSDADILNL